MLWPELWIPWIIWSGRSWKRKEDSLTRRKLFGKKLFWRKKFSVEKEVRKSEGKEIGGSNLQFELIAIIPRLWRRLCESRESVPRLFDSLVLWTTSWVWRIEGKNLGKMEPQNSIVLKMLEKFRKEMKGRKKMTAKEFATLWNKYDDDGKFQVNYRKFGKLP